MENKEKVAAIAIALHKFMNENIASSEDNKKCVGGITSAWTLKTLVMRPQPVKVSYLKPVKK
ncbi:MAG TPA: hypothetical protein PLI27_05780 [Ignavibacteriales bacterium]|nr:hypothetical protein [Ignavibacteriales bacterium]HOL81241.1 hypothetical protein [Ignavibacteriales bacterium]HOM66382.1 hypothetical protein [Ignavibacteriales bacterium]HPD67565.1 hypothetical protein [Ignavibacteriales bacterium]HPP33352.1 hypothetical protein [Ignavibacteriales bacterium]